MRILFFCYFPNPDPNAAWRRIEFFAEYFKSKGHKVVIAGAFSLLTLDKAGSTKSGGIDVINVTPVILMANVFSLIFNTVSSILTSILPFVLVRPNVIVISVPPGEAALGSYLTAKLFGIKVVFDYRDEWEDSVISIAKSRVHKTWYKSLKNLMSRCYRNSDMVVTVTEALVNSLSLRGVRNVRLVTNGANRKIFKPNSKIDSRRKIGFNVEDFILVYSGGIAATAISHYYRLDVVIKALRKVTVIAPNIKLLMVGYSSDVEGILKISKEHGLEKNVFYLGAKLDRLELAEILSASDVGIIPYDKNPLWKNSLPTKALEYLACGLPVIATVSKDSILGQLIYKNKIGLISEPEDDDALAETIEKIYHDNIFIREASQRAVLLVEKRFDRSKIAEEFLRLL